MTDATNRGDPDVTVRQRWMGVLARTPLERLEAALCHLPDVPKYVALRKPEIGSALIRARAGGNGSRFNLGEMTVTRCSVRLDSGLVGHAYIAGRKPRIAELAALFDALMQVPQFRIRLEATLIDPVANDLEQTRQRRVAKTAASKVSFFTMVRGDD